MALLVCTRTGCAPAATPEQIPKEDVRQERHTERLRKPPLPLTSESKAARERIETCLCLNSTYILCRDEQSLLAFCNDCEELQWLIIASVSCLAISVHIHMSPKRSLLFRSLGCGPGAVPRQNTVKHLLMCHDKMFGASYTEL